MTNINSMEASEPKWVNSNDIQYGVNSHRLGDLQMNINKWVKQNGKKIMVCLKQIGKLFKFLK